MKNWSLIGVLLLLLSCGIIATTEVKQSTTKVITIDPTAEDMTPVVRAAIEGVTEKDIKIVFSKGRYQFRPDYATGKYCYITNHGNGFKKIVFLLKDFDSVHIEGNGAEFIFHGRTFPFRFENCGKITVTNLRLDWDIPFNFLGEVVAVNEEEGWREVKPFTEGFSYTLKRGKIHFPDIDGFSFDDLGSTLPFDPVTRRVSHGAWDLNSNPRWVEKRPKGILRIHEPLKKYPPIGSLLNSKGDKEHNRYAPAFQVQNSKDILFKNIIVHHALGMGFLFERTENITLSGCGVYVREGAQRVVSIAADATHFANTKGDILIENCRFQHMLDDGTNVHGTYVEVDKVMDDNTVRCKLGHFEQMGFEFAGVGDDIWFIHQPSPSRKTADKVIGVKIINDQYTELTFKNKLPANLKKGDMLENKTWNPTFTMRGCTIKDHRARNIVLKTPKKIVIEDNDFSSMMSAIFFRGETFYWFESGAVEDVTIRNNRFEYCAYSGSEHAVLYVTPRLGAAFDQTELYDRNIRFENNTIKNFDSRVVIADRVDGLIISRNHIIQTNSTKPLYPDAPIFDLINCHNVQIKGNRYEGTLTKSLKADKNSKVGLVIKGNIGFQELEDGNGE